MIDFDGLVLGPCMAAFGEAATYTAPESPPVAITGTFEEFHTLVKEGTDGLQVTETKPVIGVQLSQFRLGHPVRAAAIGVSARTWIIDQVLPDGAGHAKLILKLAPRGNVR